MIYICIDKWINWLIRTIYFYFEQIQVVHQRTVESFNDNCTSTSRLTRTIE